MSDPTYKVLFELLGEAESKSGLDTALSTAELLTMRFRELYPHVTVSRPSRFLETVRRLEGPVRKGTLNDANQVAYLERVWIPRIRTAGVQVPSFPEGLTQYGLTPELLSDAIGQGDQSKWRLHGIPCVQFYRELHKFLKKTRSLTKTAIGKFYLSIDTYLQEKGRSAYNTYRFIDNLITSNVPDTAVMSYGAGTNTASLRARARRCVTHVSVKKMCEKRSPRVKVYATGRAIRLPGEIDSEL